jgi:hypothetical protein
MKRAQSPLWLMMWSTSVAGVIRPSELHRLHSGSSCNTMSRNLRQTALQYQCL